MTGLLLAKGVVERLEDTRLDCAPPLTLKQRAKAFVESSVVYEYPKGGWRGESPPNPEEDLSCDCRFGFRWDGKSHYRSCDFKDLQRVGLWWPVHDMPEHLWLYERRRQWGQFWKGGYETSTQWHGGTSPSLWRVRVAGIPESVGWVIGIGCLNRWAAFFADGTPCPYLAGPWEYVPVSSPRWQEQFGARSIHPTRWEAALAIFSGLIDAYGPRGGEG